MFSWALRHPLYFKTHQLRLENTGHNKIIQKSLEARVGNESFHFPTRFTFLVFFFALKTKDDMDIGNLNTASFLVF